MDDVTVDLGPIALNDAKAVRDALGATIAGGYFDIAENYAAVVMVKAQLSYRIAKAERVAQFVEPA